MKKANYTGSDFYCDMVLSGEIEIVKVHETENVLAFEHTRPSYPVHIVVITKQHISSLITLDDNRLLIEIMDVVKLVAKKVLDEKGEAKVVTNFGNYQDSKHLHFHVVSGKLNKN